MVEVRYKLEFSRDRNHFLLILHHSTYGKIGDIDAWYLRPEIGWEILALGSDSLRALHAFEDFTAYLVSNPTPQEFEDMLINCNVAKG